MYLLDTDIFIDIQRGHQPAINWFTSLSELPLVSGLVVMELVQGAQGSEQLKQTLKMLSPLTIVWPTEIDCNRALSDFVTYRLSHGLGLLDALIAACAVGMSMPLCTFNNKHYRMVQRLKTVQPYER